MQPIDVLIIENNLADQKLLAGYLKEYDISYQVADDGLEAQTILQNTAFKLLLLNINLPKMDGYKLAKIIRQEMNLNIPIVAITDYAIDDVKERCFNIGMNACFSKPVGKVEVVGILTQFLPKDKLSSESATGYEVIDLSYLKEISLGDKNYEIEITQKFIEAIDRDLSAIHKHFLSGNDAELKKTAHCTLSTIYIMGLKSILESPLCAIENGNLPLNQLSAHLTFIDTVCNKAKADAKLFLKYLNRSH